MSKKTPETSPAPEPLTNGEWAEREAALLSRLQAESDAANAKSDRERTAREDWVKSHSIDQALRGAMHAAGVQDIGSNDYADVIALTRNRLAATTAIDPDSGELRVTLSALDADGKPMVDANGQALGPAAIAEDFLKSRPSLLKKGFTPAPSTAPVVDQIALGSRERGQRAADRMFGKQATAPARPTGFAAGNAAADLAFGKLGQSSTPKREVSRIGITHPEPANKLRGGKPIGKPDPVTVSRTAADGHAVADRMFGKRR